MNDQQNSNNQTLASRLLDLASIFAAAVGMIYCNGGISAGSSNHVGLLPVVRRILDPNYLPGDFNIALRFYHHRAFAYLVAGGSSLLGEDRALIVLGVLAMLAISAALFGLCSTLGLSRWGFLVVGSFAATRFLWTGKGLELNEFLGDPEVMPPHLVHALALLVMTALIKEKYRLAIFLTGLAILLHLQIGVTLALMTSPLYLVKLREFGWKETAVLVALAVIPASPALWHLANMLQRGLASSTISSAYYIDFRHPHHFELISAAAAFWVAGHLVVILLAYAFFRQPGYASVPARWKKSREASEFLPRSIGKLLVCCSALIVLCLIHFTDYYLIKNDKLAQIQFLRLSPLITILGAICLAVMVTRLIESYGFRRLSNSTIAALPPDVREVSDLPKDRPDPSGLRPDVAGRSPEEDAKLFGKAEPFRTSGGEAAERRQVRLSLVVNALLLAAAVVWGGYSPRRTEVPYNFGVNRFADQRSTWVDVARWVKANGPRDTVYLAPPGRNGFSVLSERSIVAEFKLNPDGSMFLAEWFQRLSDLSGSELPTGRGFDNRRPLDKAFAKLTNEQLLALSQKYNAGYAVLHKDSKAQFEVVYQNKDYRVVKLR